MLFLNFILLVGKLKNEHDPNSIAVLLNNSVVDLKYMLQTSSKWDLYSNYTNGRQTLKLSNSLET